MRHLPLNKSLLVLVTDRKLVSNISEFFRTIEYAVAGGVDIIQVRENDLSSIEIYQLCVDLKSLIKDKALIMINDRIDIGLAAGIDGVHLTEGSLNLSDAKRIMGDEFVYSGSCHSLPRAIELNRQNIDLLIVGTMFDTQSHPGKAPEGPDLLKKITEHVDCSVVGIGGITLDNTDLIVDAGATGVAVIRQIMLSEDPEDAARKLKAKLDEALT